MVQTDGHGNSMTELAQWGQFSEEDKIFKYIFKKAWAIKKLDNR